MMSMRNSSLIEFLEKASEGSNSMVDVYITAGTAIVAASSVFVTISIFFVQQRSERRRYTAQLHDFFWSEDFKRVRELVWIERDKWLREGDEAKIIQYFVKPEFDLEKPRDTSEAERAVVRLLFFFADLNRYIDRKIVDRQLALELFGDAQYRWFSDFVEGIRKVVREGPKGRKTFPRWVSETESLERKVNRSRKWE